MENEMTSEDLAEVTETPMHSDDAETIVSVKDMYKAYHIVQPEVTVKGKLKLKKKIAYPIFEGINLEVKKGDILGILGRNGCGKSTLMKIISGIIEPDSGSVEVKGKVASILELSMGFHGDLSGRDNILLRSQFYGIPRSYVVEHLDEIIEYSELGMFIDNPVRTYSSGMRSRLAFSVMVNVNAEVFLIDEALSTGDLAFAQKASEHLKDLVRSGKTILFTSHSMGTIRRTCNRAIWIDDHKICMDGNADEVVDAYTRSITDSLEETMSLAKGGSPSAQYRLAGFYRDGVNVEEDPEQYRYWLEQAAKREHPVAMSELADILVSEGDKERAMDLYRQAADNGDFDSRRKYAVMLGETQDEIDDLRDVMLDLTKSGFPYDYYNYANLLYRSAMVPKDYEEAFHYAKIASESGWLEADYLLALMYRDGTGTERSLENSEKMFIKAAEGGHSRAMIGLADMYREGKYFQRDPEKAFKWYMASALAGNLKSQYQVAVMLAEGIGTEKDPEGSRDWFARYASNSLNEFRRSAIDTIRRRSKDEMGRANNLLKASSRSLHVPSMLALASKYEIGRDFKKNTAATLQLVTSAANAGGAPRSRLGQMYNEGKYVDKDEKRGFDLIVQAAEYGEASAMYALALIYKDGNSVVEANQEKYKMYMRMAAECGNRDAKQTVDRWDGRIERRKAGKDDNGGKGNMPRNEKKGGKPQKK